MTVPEAAVNKDHLSMARENEIGPAGKIFSVKPESQSERVSDATDDQFRTGVCAANPRHAITTL